MAPHSSTLAWKIPWMEEPGRLQSMRSLESDMTEQLHFHFSLSCIGEGNGNPLHCSCLENPRDRGAWWAAVYEVAQSRTRLKRLSSNSGSIFTQAYYISPDIGHYKDPFPRFLHLQVLYNVLNTCQCHLNFQLQDLQPTGILFKIQRERVRVALLVVSTIATPVSSP